MKYVLGAGSTIHRAMLRRGEDERAALSCFPAWLWPHELELGSQEPPSVDTSCGSSAPFNGEGAPRSTRFPSTLRHPPLHAPDTRSTRQPASALRIEHQAPKASVRSELALGSLFSSVAHGRARPTLKPMDATNLATRPITVLACNSSQPPPAVPLPASNFPDHRVQPLAYVYAVSPGTGVVLSTATSSSTPHVSPQDCMVNGKCVSQENPE